MIFLSFAHKQQRWYLTHCTHTPSYKMWPGWHWDTWWHRESEVIVTRDGATQQSSLLLSLLTLIMPPPRGLQQTSYAWYWPDTKCGHTRPGCQGRIRVTPKPARSEQSIMILKLLSLLTTSSTHSHGQLQHSSAVSQQQQYSSISEEVKVGSVVWIETMLSKWCEGRADPWGQCLGLVSRVSRAGPGNQVTTTHWDKGHQAPGYIGVMSAAHDDGSCQQIKRDSPHIWGWKNALSRQLCIPVWSAGNCN